MWNIVIRMHFVRFHHLFNILETRRDKIILSQIRIHGPKIILKHPSNYQKK